ncbi:MFS transporter [Niallia sp. NCCP-28]|uniref:MFS transporter n=1 Tax=Niallia sp. NCCP-28 TaxID=2934712 RepID=UPI00207EF88E|nr:MFS transporter [Niallia sp. NCCP-28]GKU83266.1 putative MFS-type transporter YfkL [Niallia sp. NCCP-28]
MISALENNKYFKTSIGLYINYIMFGMVNIMLASNMSFLTEHFDTDKAGISFLVSAMGFGRLCTLYISGMLSDKYNRKIFIVLAGILMAVFLIGIPLTSSYTLAVILAVLAGVANSFLDSGTYPALMEIFPEKAGVANVLVRGVISIGAILLPYIIIFIINHDIFFGVSFFIPALVFLINAIMIMNSKFPKNTYQPKKERKLKKVEYSIAISQPKFLKEGLALIAIGFTGPALLYIVQLWLPTFGEQILHLSKTDAIELVSYYSFGSLLSVAVLVITLHRFIKPVSVILIYPIISLAAITSLLIFKSHLLSIICLFIIGFSISGVLQLALTVMSEFFNDRKGEITGFVYTATSIAYTLIPFLTGLLQKNVSISSVFIFALVINGIGIGLALYVLIRYNQVFGYKKKMILKNLRKQTS